MHSNEAVARLTSEVIIVPLVIENAAFRTNLGINNLSQNIARVKIIFMDKAGTEFSGTTVQVPPMGLKQMNSIIRYLLPGSSEQTGSLRLESDQPISAWASQIDNVSQDPSILSGRVTGNNRILILSSANTGQFRSFLMLRNLGSGPAIASLRSYDIEGQLQGQTQNPISIPYSGIFSVENILQFLGVSGYGPLEIYSDNAAALVGTSRVSGNGNAGGFFEGLRIAGASRDQVIPQVVDSVEVRTNLGINNVSDYPANVKIRLMGKDGIERKSRPVTVPAKGMLQINNVLRELLGLDLAANLEASIRLESDQPIYGWASQIDNTTDDPGFALSQGEGAVHLLVQSTANVGKFKSSLVVLNNGDAIALVDILSRDTNGNITGSLRGVPVAPAGFFSTPNILESLGVHGSYGPVEIICTNGQPLMATSRVYSDQRTSGFFEAQPIN